MTQSYWFLAAAILFEVSGTTCMKLAEGFTRPVPSVLIVVFYSLCFTFLTFALKKIDISVAYAIWAGIGMALITAVGILWFKEPATWLKFASIGLIILGVVGLRLTTAE
jgi:small multidrug resistance pump